MKAQREKVLFYIFVLLLIVTVLFAFYFLKINFKSSKEKETFLESERSLIIERVDTLIKKLEINHAERSPKQSLLLYEKEKLIGLKDSINGLSLDYMSLNSLRDYVNKRHRTLLDKFGDPDQPRTLSEVAHAYNQKDDASYHESRGYYTVLREAKDFKKSLTLLNNQYGFSLSNVELLHLTVDHFNKDKVSETQHVIKTCYTIDRVPEINKDYHFYLQLINPTGEVVGDRYEVEFLDEKILYSRVASVFYKGGLEKLCYDFSVKKSRAKKGTYTLNIYNKKNIIYTGQFIFE